jgi:ribosomal protection tetracycline resistance protein
MLNLGILAHVDAGKTTLTERLLFAAGVIREPGRVDDGTTQTDTLELERRRGITIKAAVVSFTIGDVTVNLIDTPGHPDFIAEVERALRVLDGAVMVVSAVEGVQPQTRVLMRALARLRVPTLLFVNKIDRRGADPARVLRAIESTVAPAAIAMGTVSDEGTRGAAFVPDPDTATDSFRRDLAAQTEQTAAYPVYFGSAATGAGVDALMTGIVDLLPAYAADGEAPVSGTVFKIERGPAGEKVAYVRMWSGTLHTRDRVAGARGDEKVVAIEVIHARPAGSHDAVTAGEIAKVWGLAGARIGDALGETPPRAAPPQFAPPTLETVVVPATARDRRALRGALAELAEQDPLIRVHQDDDLDEITVSLYGEVQQEVLQATLAEEYGVEVTFRSTTTIYVERPSGTGEALELLQDDANPYSATVGLRIEPSALDTGVEFRLDVDPRTIPTHIYKTADRFTELMRAHVERALGRGLFGWEVTDCVVTMTQCGYYASDGPRKPTMPTARTTAADFRRLTPRVLRTALVRAGTVVCEPMVRAGIETPTPTVGAVLAAAARVGRHVEPATTGDELSTVLATVPATRVAELRRHVADLTGGEGVVETEFAGYEVVAGAPPRRTRPGS